jgi:hypothetical protein
MKVETKEGEGSEVHCSIAIIQSFKLMKFFVFVVTSLLLLFASSTIMQAQYTNMKIDSLQRLLRNEKQTLLGQAFCWTLALNTACEC